MHCFCLHQLKENGYSAMSQIQFALETGTAATCKDWATTYY